MQVQALFGGKSAVKKSAPKRASSGKPSSKGWLGVSDAPKLSKFYGE